MYLRLHKAQSVCFFLLLVFGCVQSAVASKSGELPPLPVKKPAPKLGSVLPANMALLARETPDQDNFFHFRHGYAMPVFNTKQPALPLVHQEEMAYMNTCYQKNPNKQMTIRQYSYVANTQSGKKRRLQCSAMPISKELLTAMNRHFFGCVDVAAKNRDWNTPERIEVFSWMMYQHKGRPQTKKRRGRLSMHALARALDFHQLNLFYKGKVMKVEVKDAALNPGETNSEKGEEPKENETRAFLADFRDCWDAAMIKDHGCRRWRSFRNRASLGWEDASHQSHVHLTVPFCPSNPDFQGI